MTRRTLAAIRFLAAPIGLAAMALAGCSSTEIPAEAPAWYAETLNAPKQDFPTLRDVPREVQANTDPQHWANVQAEMNAAVAAMRASPRSEPAPGTAAQDGSAFADEAREDIEATRDQH